MIWLIPEMESPGFPLLSLDGHTAGGSVALNKVAGSRSVSISSTHVGSWLPLNTARTSRSCQVWLVAQTLG